MAHMTTAQDIYRLEFPGIDNEVFAGSYIPMIQKWLDNQDVTRPPAELLEEFGAYLDEQEAEAEGMGEP